MAKDQRSVMQFNRRHLPRLISVEHVSDDGDGLVWEVMMDGLLIASYRTRADANAHARHIEHAFAWDASKR